MKECSELRLRTNAVCELSRGARDKDEMDAGRRKLRQLFLSN